MSTTDSPPPRGRERAARGIVALAACAAAVVAWLGSAKYGLGVDGDAGWTLSAADSLANGGGLVTCIDEIYSLWPPLYPGLVAGLDWVTGDPLRALGVLRFVHVIALAATVLLGARLAEKGSGSSWAGAVTAVLLASSSRLHEYTVQVVSETLFVPLVLGALLAASNAIEARKEGWLRAATVLASLACLQRYLGVVVVAVIAGALLVERGREPSRRLARAARFAALAIAPLLAWLARNYHVDAGRWTGGRDPATQSFAEVAGDTAGTLVSWASFGSVGPWTGWVSLGLGALGLAFVIRRCPSRASVSLLVAFTVSYAAVVVLACSAVQVDRVGDRLMMPVLPALVALGWVAAAGIARTVPAMALAGIAACGLAIDSGARLFRYVELWRAEGAGSFRTRMWMEHALVEPLAVASLDEPVYSNAPEHVWLLRGARGRFLMPSRRAWERAAREIVERGRPATVVWFQDDGRPKASLEALGEGVVAVVLDSGPDGMLLRVAPRAAASPSEGVDR